MIRNHIKIAWRALKKNKLYALINITGLSLGLCACLCVATVILDDLSYDTHWKHKDSIYRVLSISPENAGSSEKMASSFAGLATALPENFPEIETLVSLYSESANFKIAKNKDNIIPTAVLSADEHIWDVLNFNVLKGNPQEYVDGVYNLVITQSYKDTYFPTIDPVGLTIQDVPSYGATPYNYLITGIIEDIPTNTHLRAQALVIHKARVESLAKEGYGSFSQFYMKTKPGTNMQALTLKVNNWYKAFMGSDKVFEYEFQPVEDVYLNSAFESGQDIQGDYRTIFILSGIALLLLLIACINYVNLSVSRSLQRVKEVAVRKTLGATKNAIKQQFLIEAVLYFTLSTVLATIGYYLALPLIESYVGHAMSVTFIQNLGLLAAAYSLVLIISILIGLYPALLLARLKTAASLKGALGSSGVNTQPFVQKGLVTFQFVISMVVFIGLLVVNSQVSFMKNKDLGYNTDHLLSISNISWDDKGDTFKNRLLQIPGVTSASITSFLPGTSSTFMTRNIKDPSNRNQTLSINFIKGDTDLPLTLGMKLQKGRLFNKNSLTDAPVSKTSYSIDDEEQTNTQASLLTAHTAKVLGVQELNVLLPNAETIPIGIVTDFHNESLHEAITPSIIVAESNPAYGGMLIKMDPRSVQQSLVQLQALWKEVYPVKLLDLQWVDETLAKQYAKEAKLQQFFSFFSGLSILLAALGILGLIAQATTLRIKEIGIRKVLGASISSIVVLFSKDFIKIVLLATCIAAPLSYYFLNKWLAGFAYRTTISWWMFLAAGLAALAVALITISFQTIRTARTNPVNSLKTE